MYGLKLHFMKRQQASGCNVESKVHWYVLFMVCYGYGKYLALLN
jgi:hypothetical protein